MTRTPEPVLPPSLPALQSPHRAAEALVWGEGRAQSLWGGPCWARSPVLSRGPQTALDPSKGHVETQNQ